MNTAILFLVFNRPDTTARVFQLIRQVKPSRLYIAADGPRKSFEDEEQKCKKVRDIATNVDWDCEVLTLFRDENLGCKLAVSRGIDWFFEHEEMGIILEDDCLPNKCFFRFCEELLEYYKEEDRVMTISGNNFQPKKRTPNSYYFSKFMHCWGWASWRRAWNKYDVEMKDWPYRKEGQLLQQLFNKQKHREYWEKIFDRVYNGKIDTWDYQWTYCIWKNKGVNVLPEKNLVSNIGFGDAGTHTQDVDPGKGNLRVYELGFPLKHPKHIQNLTKADSYTQSHHFNLSIATRIVRKIKHLAYR